MAQISPDGDEEDKVGARDGGFDIVKGLRALQERAFSGLSNKGVKRGRAWKYPGGAAICPKGVYK